MNISINYLAILAAAVANMIVGMLWYGPIFGKLWMKLMGFTPESVKSMKLSPAQAMAGGFVAAFVMAFVMAHDIFVWKASDPVMAFQVAFWLWLGFVTTTQIGSFLWEGKPAKLFFLNAAYWLVVMTAQAWILVSWK